MIQSITAVCMCSFHRAVRDGQMDRWMDRGSEQRGEEKESLRGGVEATMEFPWLFLFSRFHKWHKKGKKKKNAQQTRTDLKSEVLANIMPVVPDTAYLPQMFLCITMCAGPVLGVCVYHQSSVMLAAQCQWTAGAAVHFVPRCTIASSNIKYLVKRQRWRNVISSVTMTAITMWNLARWNFP